MLIFFDSIQNGFIGCNVSLKYCFVPDTAKWFCEYSTGSFGPLECNFQVSKAPKA